MLRDAIIGLYHSKDGRFEKALHEAARQHRKTEDQFPILDDDALAEVLFSEITVAGIGGIEMARQVTRWTQVIWYGDYGNEAQAADNAGTSFGKTKLSWNYDRLRSSGLASPVSSPDSSSSRSYSTERTQRRVGLRESPCMSSDQRSAIALVTLHGSLGDSLIHRSLPKPIEQWQEKELQFWDDNWGRQWPRLTAWRDWDDDGWRWVQNFDEETIRRQLCRWAVHCPLCLIHRDSGCHDHVISSCPRVESARARDIRRL